MLKIEHLAPVSKASVRTTLRVAPGTRRRFVIRRYRRSGRSPGDGLRSMHRHEQNRREFPVSPVLPIDRLDSRGPKAGEVPGDANRQVRAGCPKTTGPPCRGSPECRSGSQFLAEVDASSPIHQYRRDANSCSFFRCGRDSRAGTREAGVRVLHSFISWACSRERSRGVTKPLHWRSIRPVERSKESLAAVDRGVSSSPLWKVLGECEPGAARKAKNQSFLSETGKHGLKLICSSRKRFRRRRQIEAAGFAGGRAIRNTASGRQKSIGTWKLTRNRSARDLSKRYRMLPGLGKWQRRLHRG